MTLTRSIPRILLACLAAAMLAGSAATTGAAAAAARPAPGPAAPAGRPDTGPGQPPLASQPSTVPPGHVAPLWRLARGARPSRYPGQRMGPDTVGEPGGYDPAELSAYLGLRGTGAGQTVAVTEAYDVQNPVPVSVGGVQDDVTNSLAGYDSWYGLSPACSATITTGCFNLTFTAPHGAACAVGDDQCISLALGWTEEAVLDVEVIHALAPQASIVVVEGQDDSDASMMAALDYAQTLHPAAVSNSWGGDEFSGERALDSDCPATGAPCVFSSGDNGNYPTCLAENGTSVNCFGYPAANPGVLAVGGTTLNLAATGKVVSESAWSGSGGGISVHEPFPAYQHKSDPYTSGRGIPDVSFDANPNSGVAVYYSYIYPGGYTDQFWAEVGGTSVGAPAWAAVLTSAAQLRAAAGEPLLTIAGLHAAVYAKAARKVIADITAGNNGICGPQCSAGPGYDLVTGMGSPRPGIDTYLASR